MKTIAALRRRRKTRKARNDWWMLQCRNLGRSIPQVIEEVRTLEYYTQELKRMGSLKVKEDVQELPHNYAAELRTLTKMAHKAFVESK